MKGISLVGIALILLGLIGFGIGNFSFTTKEKVIDLGPIEATADKKHNVAIPDILAALAVAAGVVLVVVGTKRA